MCFYYLCICAFCTEIDGALVTDFGSPVCNWRCEVLLRIVELL